MHPRVVIIGLVLFFFMPSLRTTNGQNTQDAVELWKQKIAEADGRITPYYFDNNGTPRLRDLSLQVFYCPPSVLTDVAITPQTIVNQFAYYSFRAKFDVMGQYVREIENALRPFQADPGLKGTDVRWAILVVDNFGRRYLTVFADRFLTKAQINGKWCRLDGKLRELLYRRFDTAFQLSDSNASDAKN